MSRRHCSDRTRRDRTGSGLGYLSDREDIAVHRRVGMEPVMRRRGGFENFGKLDEGVELGRQVYVFRRMNRIAVSAA